MNAIETIAQAVHDTGYRPEAVVRDYAFADVLVEGNTTRSVPLVAFTRTPPSYRSAALAVVESNGRQGIDLVREHRALGAPLLFVIENDDVVVWQVRSEDPPRAVERIKIDELTSLFERKRETWHPDAIHRAKAVGSSLGNYQLDFVDIGLIPAIEGEIHIKLDRLLVETLNLVRDSPIGGKVDPRTLFRVIFRLLAAKVLQDRRHPFSEEWDSEDLSTVLAKIEVYYNLGEIKGQSGRALPMLFSAAWQYLQAGISFSNISSDDLAFVYENTLVTPETRKLFGTHSTPRQVAEYVVQRLELHLYDSEDLKIYEPFAGAGVFLVSALRHLRDLLPVDWSDQRRHDFLIDHISGDEIDPFACEVATLSLILADYPNHNGWLINETDLLLDGALDKRLADHNVIVCNPPFEAFSAEEKAQYPGMSQKPTKASAVLNAVLDARPLALGFVLPRSFILEKQFSEHRKRIEALYGSVEILEMPDRIFGASSVESAALIARDLRPESEREISIRSSEVADRSRAAFLKTGAITVKRDLTRQVEDEPSGHLWIPPLHDLWTHLKDRPTLNTLFRPRWGLRWNYDQMLAASDHEQSGYRRGYLSARRFQQFFGTEQTWLDFNLENLREGFDQDWSKPKIIMNAARLSRGPWRAGAIVDGDGCLYSQQFFGLWPQYEAKLDDLFAYSAVLNSPVANAFLAIRSPQNRFRSSVVGEMPIPARLPSQLGPLVQEYVHLLRDAPLFSDAEERVAQMLVSIDAAVLCAYDLPLRLERQLLEYFKDAERPVPHHWQHWDTLHHVPGLSLSETVSGQFNATGDWVKSVFQPLPEDEISLLRDYVA